MQKAASNLEFERAGKIRDLIRDLELTMMGQASPLVAAPQLPPRQPRNRKDKEREAG
jgi:hypothetical protein